MIVIDGSWGERHWKPSLVGIDICASSKNMVRRSMESSHVDVFSAETISLWLSNNIPSDCTHVKSLLRLGFRLPMK